MTRHLVIPFLAALFLLAPAHVYGQDSDFPEDSPGGVYEDEPRPPRRYKPAPPPSRRNPMGRTTPLGQATRETLDSPDWWQFVSFEGQLWQTTLRSELMINGTSTTGSEVDQGDMEINREYLIPAGEIRLGFAPIHLRGSFLDLTYKGSGTSEASYQFGDLAVTNGQEIDSEIQVQDYFIDLNVSALYSHREDGPFATFQFYLGIGYFAVDQKVEVESGGRHRQKTDVISWHYGVKSIISVRRWFSFFVDLNYGDYESNELEVANFTVFRFRGGFQLNLTRHLQLGLEFRYHYYRVNAEGAVSKVELWGPAIFGRLNF